MFAKPMNDPDAEHFYNVAAFGFVAAVLISGLGWLVEAPYGKLASGDYLKLGAIKIPEVPLEPRLGWFLMELPATLSFLYFYPQGSHAWEPLPLFLAALFIIHYLNRGFYFPFNLRVSKGQKHSFSIIIVVFGWLATSVNGYLTAKWYSEINTGLTDPASFLMRPNFIVGLIIYEIGYINTIYCEHILRNLRTNKPGEPRYKIPRGGAFEYVTSPQYFFELVAWFGFALMTYNPGGLFIFLISCANLVPRAFQTHAWYKKQFGDDYPKERRVLVPFLI